MSFKVESAGYQFQTTAPEDDELMLPTPPAPPPRPEYDDPGPRGLQPGASIEYHEPYDMPIYNPPDVTVPMPIYDPYPPPIPTPTITPITREEAEAMGIQLPIPGDVNGDRQISPAEDEFRNGSAEPFETWDSSDTRDPWTTERYT